MNRRDFLTFLAPAAALIVTPELILPRKTFFLPPLGGWGGISIPTAAGLTEGFVQALKWRLAWELANPPLVVGEGNRLLASALQPVLTGTYKRFLAFDVAPEGWPSEWPKT